MPSATAVVVYVGNSDTQDISVFELGAEGTLAPRATLAVQQPVHPGRSMLMATSPDRKFLYAGFLSDDAHSTAATYAIEPPSGLLSLLGKVQLPDIMSYLSVDRSGRFLLTASYAGDKVVVNAIRADGTVGKTLQVRPTAPKAHCILTDPSNRTVLHTALGGDVICQDRFDADTGALVPLDPPAIGVKAKAGPQFLIFSRDGRFVYVINELDGSLDVFPFDTVHATLQPKSQATTVLPAGFSGRPWAADIHMTPDGRYLYGSERTSSTLAAFRVDPTNGTLTAIESFPTVRQPRAFSIDPSGKFLLSSGQLSNSIMSYSIDADSGRLDAIGEYPVGKNPTWVESVQLP